MPSRLQIITTAACACGLFAAGCGSSSSSAPATPKVPTPVGYDVHHTQGAQIALPHGWDVQTQESEPLSATGPADGAGVHTRVHVGTAHTSTFDEAVSQSQTASTSEYPQQGAVAERTVKVKGATQARVRETEVPANSNGDAPIEPVRLVDVVARGKNGTTVDVNIQAPAAAATPQAVPQIVDSIQVPG